MKKKLSKLLICLPDYDLKGKDLDITGIVDDSRKVKKGNLFVAVKGINANGHDYFDVAAKNGAIAIVGEIERPKDLNKNVTYVKVSNSRKALSLLVSEWFDNPSQKLTMIGVTGTDGKTTTTNLIYEILTKAKKKVGMISTISAKIGNKEYDTGFHVTNPDPTALHKFLKKMVERGCKYAVIEVTSHGLDQGRVEGINFEIGVLTNITHEHLDYHKTFENYRDTKLKLFLNAKYCVLNKDDKSFEFLKKSLKNKSLATYSLQDKKCDIFAKEIKLENKTSRFGVVSHATSFNVTLGIPNKYNISNSLAAMATTAILGVKPNAMARALKSFKALAGRMEEIGNKKGIRIIVDFAHTDNGLRSILKSLNEIKKKNTKLISVFGCASERDVTKRPMMAKSSTSLADISIFTAEDPRREDINKIIQDMVDGVDKKTKEFRLDDDVENIRSGKWFMRIPERGDAISFAINKLAKKGDTVVILGKGHEKSMAYFGVEYPWSDQKASKMALEGKVMKIKRK